QRKFAEAKSDFETAIAKDAKFTLAWTGRGQFFLLDKQYDKAISDATHAIELDPKSASAYGLRGKSYLAKRNPDLAIRDLKKALSLDKKNWFAVSTLQALQSVKALEQLGQIKKTGGE